jgi:hypothetical protein
VSDVGFFELADAIWDEADERRADLSRHHGEDLGNWLADMKQYGAAWWGDVWEWTAIGAERHTAFATIPPTHPWDYRDHWGGWRKPHKPDPETDEHGMSPATQIGTPSRDGMTTWAVVQP